MLHFINFSRWVRYMSTKSQKPAKGVEHWENNYFPQGGMLKFTYKGHFLTIKRAYQKLYWKSKWQSHALVCLLHTRFFFLRKLKSQFWWYFFNLIVFGQILTKFGSYGQFWTDSSAMALTKSMPSFEKKKTS